MKASTRKYVLSLVFAIGAIALGTCQLIVYDRSAHNIFIGVLWLVYGVGSLLTLPKRNDSESQPH